MCWLVLPWSGWTRDHRVSYHSFLISLFVPALVIGNGLLKLVVVVVVVDKVSPQYSLTWCQVYFNIWKLTKVSGIMSDRCPQNTSASCSALTSCLQVHKPPVAKYNCISEWFLLLVAVQCSVFFSSVRVVNAQCVGAHKRKIATAKKSINQHDVLCV